MQKQPDTMLGESLALSKALDHLSRLATIQRPVLILGERGAGKELAAERLHFLSPRWGGPFIKLNCAAVTETLLESELFGHEAGAFTGATRRHIGRFERAHGGTLLLDEIGTMTPRLQEKLLRFIEYGEFERVGGDKTLSADLRVIGATNADLRALAAARAFRADLLDRLSFDVVHMPPLRHRDGDTLLLAQHFAVQMSAELGWELFPGFSEDARRALLEHPWPGNVRELKNAVERSLHRWGNAALPVPEIVIDPFASPWAETAPPPARQQSAKPAPVPTPVPAPAPAPCPASAAPLRERVERYERELLSAALQAQGYHQRRSAEALGLSYDQLRGLMRKHRIRRPRDRKAST